MSDHDDTNLYELPLDVSSRRKIERGRGRPRVVAKRPRYSEPERRRWLREQLRAHVEEDALVKGASNSAGPRELIDTLCEEVARECAGLEWERLRQTPGTRTCERVSSRRVHALGDLGRLQLLRRELADDAFDPRQPAVQRVVNDLVERVTGVAESVLPPDSAATLITAWRKALSGWEDEVDSA